MCIYVLTNELQRWMHNVAIRFRNANIAKISGITRQTASLNIFNVLDSNPYPVSAHRNPQTFHLHSVKKTPTIRKTATASKESY